MKKGFYILIMLAISLHVFAQTDSEELNRDSVFSSATNKWFTAWKLVSKDIFRIDKVKPVEFVFFDDKYVYSTSTISIKKGTLIRGWNLMNLKFQWRKELHNDSITLPDKSVVPVNLMSFAAKNSNDSIKTFFVMPLPDFWEKAGITSKEVGLDNLVTGVFIHEFSHSQQMENFGTRMTVFEQQNDFGVEFTDDIVQNIFGKDSVYTQQYKKEVALFFAAIRNKAVDKNSLKEGLAMMNERQKNYFKNKHENLKLIDDFFLTMEGLGQYSMFLWLTHPKGAGIKREVAIEGVRRGGRYWSQDEGFALFLILDKLTPPAKWVKGMFGKETEGVIGLIGRFDK